MYVFDSCFVLRFNGVGLRDEWSWEVGSFELGMCRHLHLRNFYLVWKRGKEGGFYDQVLRRQRDRESLLRS